MKSEIKILLEQTVSNKAKGNCFEDLMRNLLSTHQYKIRGNINFSGMEIDLIADHKHTHETLYVECKAKEKVSADELTKFCFNVGYKEVDKGYFFRTQELESQAGALLSELKTKPKYKNLHFFEPDDIIKMLSDAKMIFQPNDQLAKYSISKKILVVSYIGDFFVYLVNESNAFPTKFIIVNANTNNKLVNDDQLEIIKNRIDEITNLEVIRDYSGYYKIQQNDQPQHIIEAISEVQESENWYDYLPASANKNHFVGRIDIRTRILGFFKEIKRNKSSKRIFYLNGKSGWGKSSLVLELKDRCRNKHFKNNFYSIAIDTRSAISDNFVALSFKKLINSAIKDKFLDVDIFFKEIKFTSNVDLLSSDSVNSLLSKLNAEGKILVLIFDQFEDVFRKKDYFKTFYKFLTDVTDKKPNLIIGFSWKSDFFIQSDDPSYHIWQQAREQAREFTVSEFGEKEIDGIIKQLEGSVGDLNKSIKDRIKESSQGLPWLTKKLCIHIYDQIKAGLIKENLIESNLNILDLFKKDEESVSTNELKALKLIAKRAYDGNFFDETEVGDLISSDTITSLLHKRLVIRSGANYNIYWDIYRDYLVTSQIPPIGESYLLRQGVNVCLEVFLLFNSNRFETIESLLSHHPKEIGKEALNNIIIELRNLGIVQKASELLFIDRSIHISKQGFINFITNKFHNYTPYLYLKKSGIARISKVDVIPILRSIFKQDFQDNTWDAYANNLINWFLFSDLDIKSKLVESSKGRNATKINITLDKPEELILRSSLREIMEIIPLLFTDKTSIKSKFNHDLLIIGLIDKDKNLTGFARELSLTNESLWRKMLQDKALELPKLQELKITLKENPRIKAKELIQIKPKEFFDGIKDSSRMIYATNALTWIK